MKNNFKWFILFCLLSSFIPGKLFAGGTGTIKGVVIDTITGEPLPGAAIAIKKQSLGAFSNTNGEFVLNNVPAGSNTLTISYLGYKVQELTVDVSAKETKTINFKLEVLANNVDEIVVTAQARGQRAAINQQLASTTISNVISVEKMKELPDANAAEAIGRLPGISLQRDNGEADKVVVRGLSAKYNNITLEGLQMVSTSINDRSVDLSLVQSESLSGVDVSKSLRADLDAAALGGTVNLQLGKAADIRKFDVSAQGSYVNLTNALNNYKFSLAYSDRFLNKKLGVSLRISNELKQVPTQEFDGTYSNVVNVNGTTNGQYYITTDRASLLNQSDARDRTNGALILDYQNSWWDVKFLNLLSWKNDANLSMTDAYLFNTTLAGVGGESLDITAEKALWQTFTRSHILKNEFNFGNSKIDLVLGATYGQQNEKDNTFPFIQTVNWPQLANAQGQIQNAQPSVLINKVGGPAKWDTTNTFLESIKLNSQKLITRNYDVKLDYELSYSFLDFISGKLKLGGKYHTLARESGGSALINSFQWGQFQNNRAWFNKFMNYTPQNIIADNLGIPAGNFVQTGYTPPKFLNGAYSTGWQPDINKLMYAFNKTYAGPKDINYYVDGSNTYPKMYDANENSSAGYIETELNIGSQLMVLPGIRYESYTTKYSAYAIQEKANALSGIQGNPPLITVERFHKDWFPSVNLKYKVNNDISIQGAAYKSTSKPDFSQITPLIIYPATPGYVNASNPYLNPSSAQNYDLGVSYNNKLVGLLTVYGFYKQIDNLIFTLNNYKPSFVTSKTSNDEGIIHEVPGGDSAAFNQSILGSKYFSTGANVPGDYISMPVNNPETAYLKGLELSWSTNFWYLPGLLKGIVLDVNYTVINSSTQYPYVNLDQIGKTKLGVPIQQQDFHLRSGALVDMPKSIFNVILGYDLKGFSARVSYRYQTKTLTGLDGEYSSKDTYYAPFSLLDLNLSQKINKHLSCFVNLTNITNHIDNYYFYNSYGSFPTTSNYYGFRTDVGIRANF